MANPVLFDSGNVAVAEADSETLSTLDQPGVYVIYINPIDMVAGDDAVVRIPTPMSGGEVVVPITGEQTSVLTYVTTVDAAALTGAVAFEYTDGTGASVSVDWAIHRIAAG